MLLPKDFQEVSHLESNPNRVVLKLIETSSIAVMSL